MSTIFRRMQFERDLSLPRPSLSRSARTSAAQADVVEEQQKIREMYAVQVRAFEARDAEPIIAMESANFTLRNAKGRVFSKAEADAIARSSLKATREVPLAKIEVNSIAVKGDEATAIVTHCLRLVMADASGRICVYAEDSRRRDSWVLNTGGWQMRASQMLSGEVVIDGRTVNKL